MRVIDDLEWRLTNWLEKVQVSFIFKEKNMIISLSIDVFGIKRNVRKTLTESAGSDCMCFETRRRIHYFSKCMGKPGIASSM